MGPTVVSVLLESDMASTLTVGSVCAEVSDLPLATAKTPTMASTAAAVAMMRIMVPGTTSL